MIIFYSGVRDSDGERPELVVPGAAVMPTFADIYYNKGGQLRYVLRVYKQRLKARRTIQPASAEEVEAAKEQADRRRDSSP